MKIITRLQGGIGNQIFQYAVGRSIAIKHNAELLLDDSLFKQHRFGVTPRDYELDVYNIQARKLDPDEKSILQFRAQRFIRYFYDLGLVKASFTYYREPHFEFDSMLHQLTGNLIIEGYWHSERYFANIADELRRELQPTNPPPDTVMRFLDEIQKGNSVSVHVRRGDYITNLNAAAHHVLCDLSYYQEAVAVISERVNNPVFFVFTDDPEWVEKNFKIDFPMFLVSRPHTWSAYEDLRLMSHCAHHIISNSSFSWWGAWLNSNPNKIVVAPSRWFRVEKNLKDLIPPEWIVVQNSPTPGYQGHGAFGASK